MKNRETVEKKLKAIFIRLTEDELWFIKQAASARRMTITRLVLEAMRCYLNKS